MNFIQGVLWERDRELENERRLMEDAVFKGGQTKGKVDVLPTTFAEAIYLLDGRPLRLKNRSYLHAIHNLPITDGLLMCGRQVEKSTTFSIKIANDTLMQPFHRALYFAPLNEQVKVFSEDRLGRLFEYSQQDVVKKQYIRNSDKQNVFNKSFGVNGALIYLRHAYGLGDNIRGISVNSQYGDEIQDVYVDALPVISETQAHAYDLGPGIKRTWYAGTPKTFSNTIQYLWDKSNQMEWVVRCPGCCTDQILGEKNLAPDRYVCRKCGKTLTSDIIDYNGRWVPLNRDSKKYGFRISQMISPSMYPSDVYEKAMNYPRGKFFNEVLGRSYENASKPIPRSVLMRLLANEERMLSAKIPPYMDCPVTMGVDWGHGTTSFTVVVIYAFVAGKFKMLFTHKFKEQNELDVNFQKRCIKEWMAAFHVDYFIGDYGDGFEQGQEFKLIYGSQFDMCYYSWNQNRLTFYDPSNMFWTVNRDRCLYWYIEDIKKQMFEWPGGDLSRVQHLIKDHEVIQAEYRSTETRSKEGNVIVKSSNVITYTHPVGVPDDSTHASFYAWFAMRYLLNMPIDPTQGFNADGLIASTYIGGNQEDDASYY